MSVRHTSVAVARHVGLLRRLQRAPRVSESAMPPVADAPLTEGVRETQRWVERSIQRCQCPTTTRFLEMVSVRIAAHLREMDNASGVGD